MTQVHLTKVTDPDFGTILATVDADGRVLACDAAQPFVPTNVTLYQDAVRAWAAELADLYADTHPGHAEWLRRLLDADRLD